MSPALHTAASLAPRASVCASLADRSTASAASAAFVAARRAPLTARLAAFESGESEATGGRCRKQSAVLLHAKSIVAAATAHSMRMHLLVLCGVFAYNWGRYLWLRVKILKL